MGAGAAGKRAHTIAIVGLGAIGSQLVGLIARLPTLARLILIDFDYYEYSNLHHQNITPADIAESKVIVQAGRVRALRALVAIEPVVARFEELPRGGLRADVVLACVDTMRARQAIAETCWLQDTPLIDAGVRADGLLARIDVFVPGDGLPCIECGWSDTTYEALEQRYACAPGDAAGPTAAPPMLGALAASLQAIEATKMLRRDAGALAPGSQVLIDAAHHRHYVTARTRNPACRFHHETPAIRRLRRPPSSLTVGELLAMAAPGGHARNDAWLRVDGFHFTRKLRCVSCGAAEAALKLDAPSFPRPANPHPSHDNRCPRCPGFMEPAGAIHARARLDASSLSAAERALSCAAAGLRAGEVVTVGSGAGELHFQLGGDARETR